MKTIVKRNLLFFAMLLFGSGAFAQSYMISSVEDTNGVSTFCDSIVILDIWNNGMGTNPDVDHYYNVITTAMSPGNQMTITVTWGDGTANTYVGTYQSPNLPLVPAGTIQHAYPAWLSSTYPITVSVVNTFNNSQASNSDYLFALNCPLTIYGVTNIDCDSNGIFESSLNSGVEMILTNLGGMSYPFTTSPMGNSFLNLPTGNYVVTINPTWLSTNGFQILNITPSTFSYQSGLANAVTIAASVYCDTINQSNDGCFNGRVFCDANNNGQFDGGEMGVANAPITVTYNNQLLMVNSDPNGYYSVTVPNGAQTPAVVSINGNWLAQNGYQFTSNTSTVTPVLCQSGLPSPMVNFPVNCDSAQVSTECIFGWVFCDANGNGTLDSGEVPLVNAPIQITGNSFYATTIYTDTNGVFNYSGQAIFGIFAILTIPNWWLTQQGYTMINNVITIQTNCNNLTPAYFAVNCSPTFCADLWTTVNPWIGYYQNTTNYVKLKWGNNGPNTTSGYTLSFTYPSSVTPVLSSIQNPNYVISGNTITWTFGPGPSYINQQDIIEFFVPSGYPSGTSHTYSSTITALGTTTDCNALNNDGSLCMILGNSYDPNDKSTSLPPIIDPTVQDKLTYVIRFQNTGTAPAQDVYIIDSLSANLDWSTLQVISASHNMQLVDLGNGVMKFNFPGIWLPDSTTNEPASHGDVVFTIKENAGNGIGSVIENTGYIYFDWNPAIITNTTVNENNVLGLDDAVNEVGISPNPFTGAVKVESAKKIDLITVVDITGKVIFETKVNAFNAQLDLSHLTQGIYFVNVTAGAEVSTSKVVKH